MRSTRLLLPAACGLAALLPLFAQSGAPSSQRQHLHAAQTAQSKKDSTPDGQKLFRQNCARCHDAPQSFPPQITGTIVRHMRVRASLKAEDENALLQFMNP
jgi:mono/diheme cytochrome c family protein